jgi:hypothetical protein
MPIRARLVVVTVMTAQLAFLLASSAGAQSADERPAGDRAVSVTLGYEISIERLRYRFENPSTFDTPFLVPHAFTQSYRASNQWVVAAVAYRIGGDRFATEAGFAPPRRTRSSDFDTFNNPGDIIVYGTDGRVQMHSWRLAQWSDATLFRLPWRLGYRYRRDRMQFLPTDRIVTHSSPPSEARSPTFGHETTISQVHEIPLEVSRLSRLPHGWTLRLGADISPLVWGRLTTKLPDKYPGRDIVFDAKAFGYGGRLAIEHRRERWPVGLAVHYGQTRRYAAARQLHRPALLATATLGVR